MIKKSEYNLGLMVLFTIIPFFFFSQSKKAASLTIDLHHEVNKMALVLDDSTYINSLNQSFTISKFNYYISQVNLVKSDNEKILIKDYHFVSEEEKSTKMIKADEIPEGEYTSIEFILGVDSSANCSGVQSGDLDPIYGMFWTWNTGYIFLKLEGNSSASSATGNTLEYHIGGYMAPTNSIRKIRLDFDSTLIFDKKTKKHLDLKVKIDELLSHPNSIDFSKDPVLNTPLQSKKIADNYQYLFELKTGKKDVK